MKQSIQHLVQQIRTPASTDQVLLEQLRSNDPAAFQELVHRYSRLVWAVCRSQLACEADAEDAYQSAFLVLYQRHTSIRKPEQIGSWLYQVAFRICVKVRRAQQRRQRYEIGAARAEGSEVVVATQLWDETLQQVYEIVAGLPETYRTAFVLCCLEGKGLTETAEQLGWKLGTLSGRLSRAKAKVIKELQSKGLCMPVLATIGLATPAAALPARTAEMLINRMNIPANISQFAQGALTMYSTGKMVVAFIIATTLVLTVGNRWLTQSAAQQPTVQTPSPTQKPKNSDSPTSNEDKLKNVEETLLQLFQLRFNEIEAELKELTQQQQLGLISEIELRNVHERLLTAVTELYADNLAKQKPYFEAYLELANKIQNKVQKQFNAGLVNSVELHRAKAMNYDAQIKLLMLTARMNATKPKSK
ncbi:MAG: sigma-70 family RNA polymerase sigma factor [Zavarzinella sp.]